MQQLPRMQQRQRQSSLEVQDITLQCSLVDVHMCASCDAGALRYLHCCLYALRFMCLLSHCAPVAQAQHSWASMQADRCCPLTLVWSLQYIAELPVRREGVCCCNTAATRPARVTAERAAAAPYPMGSYNRHEKQC